MKKVRYTNIGNLYYGTLRNGGIYDVISYIPSSIDPKYDMIEIYNDDGIPRIYDMFAFDDYFFIDVTIDARNKIIDDVIA